MGYGAKKARKGLLAAFCVGVGMALSVSVCAASAETVLIADMRTPLAAVPQSLQTSSPGTVLYSSGDAVIDASNAAEGYVTVKYTGSSSAAKVRITCQGKNTYTYNLRTDGQYEVFPFSGGNGKYQVEVYAHVVNSQYALSLTQSIDVTLRDPMRPFLYPNQYVNYNASSAAVRKGSELAQGAAGTLAVVSQVYNYVIRSVTYDYDKADIAKAGNLSWYIPNVDTTLATNKGICFDYSALMASMLRSQQIPTKVEVGYVTGGTYHAWINVYVPEAGWINGVIYFDGVNWKLMDPTFAAGAQESAEIMAFINNTGNYRVIYTY